MTDAIADPLDEALRAAAIADQAEAMMALPLPPRPFMALPAMVQVDPYTLPDGSPGVVLKLSNAAVPWPVPFVLDKAAALQVAAMIRKVAQNGPTLMVAGMADVARINGAST